MARLIPTFLTVVLLSLTSTIAHADSFGVTLRYWLTEQRFPGTTNVTFIIGVAAEDIRSEVPAVTLRWSPDFWEDHDFLLSYFALDPSGRVNVLVADGFPGDFFSSDFDTSRSDLEFLIRSRASNNFFLYYGLRSIDAENAVTINRSGAPQEQLTTQDWLLAEVGVGIAVPVSENGRHSVFANALGGIGRIERDTLQDGVSFGASSDTAYTIDLNLGYQYTLTQAISFSLRYRDLGSFIDNEKSTEFTGIDLGLTFNF